VSIFVTIDMHESIK